MPARRQGGARGGRPSSKVRTYNVNYGIAGGAATMRVIEESRADVVFLQETTPLSLL